MENVNQQYIDLLLSNKHTNVLECYSANEWIDKGKLLDNPKPLFGNIWSETEVGILFADTGQGKSILAVQIADAIASGKSVLGLSSTKSNVLFLDCELSTKSFQRRYTGENDSTYLFSDNLIRAELRVEKLTNSTDSIDKILINSVLEIVLKRQIKVVIIDNISFLSESNEKSKDANALMKAILNLSRNFGLAILIIAHTPKREFFKSMRIEDLAGSKALANFCDIAFCIGPSIKSSQIKYIKELKNRNNPIEFHDDNIMECEIDKSEGFLKLKFNGLGKEKDHVLNNGFINSIDEENIFIKVAKKYKLSNVEIANILGVSEKTIRNRIIKGSNKSPNDSEV